jgi:hypothetical protein
MKKRTLILTNEHRQQLEALRDASPKPYLRERAGALLKIADGMAAYAVSQAGLLKVREPDTIYAWLDRYQAQGLEGLISLPRRKAFSPCPLPGGDRDYSSASAKPGFK